MTEPTEICTYCAATTDEVEAEHVFPESWYPDGVPPSAMLTVPSCPACNDRYDKLEERVRGRLGLILAGATDPEAKGVADRVLRSINPGKAKSERDARHRAGRLEQLRREMNVSPIQDLKRVLPANQQIRPSWLKDPATGMWQFGLPSVRFDTEGLNQLTEKFTRGVYRKLQGKTLAAATAIRTPIMMTNPIETLEGLIRAHKMDARGGPGFRAWHTRATEDDTATMTLFLIWGRIVLCGITGQLAAAMDAPGAGSGDEH